MGVWGHGNFDSDDTLNVLSGWINQVIQRIREVYSYEKKDLYTGRGEADIVANVDILGTLYDKYRIYPDLELAEVADWKREYLDTFDFVSANYNQSEAIEGAKLRRPIIEATFDRLYGILTEIIQEDKFEE